MSNMFDMVNNALMRELEKLDNVDPSTDAGRAEIDRAKALHAVAATAIDNARVTVSAIGAVSELCGTAPASLPALLGCGRDA